MYCAGAGGDESEYSLTGAAAAATAVGSSAVDSGDENVMEGGRTIRQCQQQRNTIPRTPARVCFVFDTVVFDILKSFNRPSKFWCDCKHHQSSKTATIKIYFSLLQTKQLLMIIITNNFLTMAF